MNRPLGTDNDSAWGQHAAADAWSQTSALQAAYRRDFLSLNGDLAGRLAAQDYLDNSSAIYHGEVVSMGFLPKIYDRLALEYFASIVDRTYAILDKLTRHYIQDAGYRQLFGFSPRLERLIALPAGYDCSIPIARLDIFLDERSGDFKFCEFNTDGSSAMNEDREICNALSRSALFARYNQQRPLLAQELFDSWVQAFWRIYQASEFAQPDPTVAIVDYRKSATLQEHLEFQRRFQRFGIRCLVVDMADLVYIDGVLYGSDVAAEHSHQRQLLAIDAIYRRAVTAEILDELESLGDAEFASLFSAPPGSERQASLAGCAQHDPPPAGSAQHDPPLATTAAADPAPSTADPASPAANTVQRELRGAAALVAAVAQQAVCMLGGFRTQVAHSKAVFVVLHLPQTAAILSSAEQDFIRRHLPYTTWLRADSIDLERVKREKDAWIIKPVDGYGTVGVFAGKALPAAEWNALIDAHSHGGYVVQEYCRQFSSPNTLPVPKDRQGQAQFTDRVSAQAAIKAGLFSPTQLQEYNILTGLFSYGGRFAGSYLRAGQHALIVGFQGGIALGSLISGYESDAPDTLQADPDSATELAVRTRQLP